MIAKSREWPTLDLKAVAKAFCFTILTKARRRRSSHSGGIPLLRLNHCLSVQPSAPYLTRSTLDRCLKQYGIYHLQNIERAAN